MGKDGRLQGGVADSASHGGRETERAGVRRGWKEEVRQLSRTRTVELVIDHLRRERQPNLKLSRLKSIQVWHKRILAINGSIRSEQTRPLDF